jgi:hypothetical protein
MNNTELKKQLVDLLIKAHVTFDTHAVADHLIEHGCTIQPIAEWREQVECYDDEYSECNYRKVLACTRCGRIERYEQPYCNCGAKMFGRR